MEAAAPRPFSWVLFPTLFPAFPALCPSLLACFQGCACVLGTEIAFCAIRHIRHSFATPHPWSETVRHSQAELVTVFVAQYNVWGLHRKLWVHHGWLMHIYPHNPTQILIFGWTPFQVPRRPTDQPRRDANTQASATDPLALHERTRTLTTARTHVPSAKACQVPGRAKCKGVVQESAKARVRACKGRLGMGWVWAADAGGRERR